MSGDQGAKIYRVIQIKFNLFVLMKCTYDYQRSLFRPNRYHGSKHLSQLYPQDGAENQPA